MFKSNFLIAFFLALAPVLARSEIPDLEIASGSASRQGVVKLEWASASNTPNQHYELQQANEKSFVNPKTIYSGADQGTFLSGLSDGTYYFRIKQNNGLWSNIVTIEINHHALPLALLLMGIGAVVFIVTMLVILQGRKNQETI